MTAEDIKKVSENILKLFNILNSDGAYQLVTKLDRMVKGKKTIEEKINSLNDKQLAEIVMMLGKLKYKERPDEYFSEIVKIYKSNK
jgi:hypothetical protein